MEISEFLTRIDLKGADGTLFKREEKDVKIVTNGVERTEKRVGINTYTFFENGSAGAVGFIMYDKEFPEQVFSMNPSILKKILEESQDIQIEDTFLVGKSNHGDIREDIEPAKWRTVKGKYDNPPIKIKKDIISRIIKRSQIIDPNRITLKSDGKELTIMMYSRIGSSTSEVKIPCEQIVETEPEGSMFLEILDRVGDQDMNMYVDVLNPEGRKRSPTKIEISDKTAVISYYITETHVSTSKPKEDKEKTKKTKKKDKEEKETEPEPDTVNEQPSEELNLDL
jgi:hypothetical protein